MRFFSLLPVRDEAEIIEQSIRHLLTWSDFIYVFDTGSVDGTWEIVCDLAQIERRIVPLRRDPVYFNDTIVRGWIFHQARQIMRTGDWFLRVDADEFHHVPPPLFVKERLRPYETIVYHQYYNFVLLKSEVDAWNEGKESMTDRIKPIEERRRWYQPSVYSEPRMCRYRDTMHWPPSVSFPYNAGYLAAERLPIRHYAHRDPVQLERRCFLRAMMMADQDNRSNWSAPELHHWAMGEWENLITPDDAPGLHYWLPETELPEVHQSNHLAKPAIRSLQRLAHAFLLPILDQTRTGWPDGAYPKQIPAAVARRMETELGTNRTDA
ncbi:hypothetical protein FEM03_14540 [Phragmitibacter flavus]|uniref:Uncharacterized protein n=2 Tax=Phragmitibacter flavus TaxID=2576071 RepID=A0A5R8KCR7_9BACT|nr:hypothetical protein FEM03_14540 [Phragmitibacter flavus]